MDATDAELEAVLAGARAAGDAALVAETLGALGRRRLAAGDPAAGLRLLREAAACAEPLGEGALGRALGELALALGGVGEAALAARTLEAALAHLARAEDREGAAELALASARAADERGAADAGDAWATAAARCAAAGREGEELAARVAAARAASAGGDTARALAWLEDLAPRFDRLEERDATWARGELGALWLRAGRAEEALPLLVRAAQEEAAAGRREAAAARLFELRLCRTMLGPGA